MVGYIYLITDTTNGKKYVGQHHYDKEELDPSYHGSGVIVTRIFSKRPDTLKYEYLKTCYNQKELDEWEKYFIYSLNTLHPNGYNLTEGGEGVAGCEETRRKISEANKGKTVPEERRKKISESVKKTMTREHRKLLSDIHLGKCSGENHYLYGKHLADETRNKLSVSHKNGKLSKPILQYKNDELVGEWVSISEIQRQLGYNPSHISKCCRGKLKQHKGFIWKYKEVS